MQSNQRMQLQFLALVDFPEQLNGCSLSPG